MIQKKKVTEKGQTRRESSSREGWPTRYAKERKNERKEREGVYLQQMTERRGASAR